MKVAGYPAGEPGVTAGPVSSRDDANFVVKVALSTGNSGSPAIDDNGRLAGLAVLDHEDAGAIFIGPGIDHVIHSPIRPVTAPRPPAGKRITGHMMRSRY